MKMILVLALVLSSTFVSCDIPNVYEFCSALMSDRQISCSNPSCQGQRGAPGPKGSKGDMGPVRPGESCKMLEEEVDHLKDEIKLMRKRMIPEQKIAYCGMGMTSRDIRDSAISASSDWESHHHGQYGRLDEMPASNPVSYGAWIPRKPSTEDWIQIDLGEPKTILGIVTQGRPVYSGNQWVTSFKVRYGNKTSHLVTMLDKRVDKIFTANTDKDTKVTNIFPHPITCRYIRVYPQTWHNWMCMRMELLRGDCFDIY